MFKILTKGHQEFIWTFSRFLFFRDSWFARLKKVNVGADVIGRLNVPRRLGLDIRKSGQIIAETKKHMRHRALCYNPNDMSLMKHDTFPVITNIMHFFSWMLCSPLFLVVCTVHEWFYHTFCWIPRGVQCLVWSMVKFEPGPGPMIFMFIMAEHDV